MPVTAFKKSGPGHSSFRVPPQNIEAEQNLLGGLLVDETALPRVIELVQPSDFYKEAHGIIYSAILNLFDRNEPRDLVTVHNALLSTGKLEAVGGASYLAELADIMPFAANIEYYARIVRDKSLLRKLIQASAEIAGRCYEDSGGDVDDILADAESSIFEISQQKLKKSFHPIRGVLTSSIKKIESLFERKEMVTGIPSGFDDLDKLTAGFQPSDLIIIAGRPSMGKTAFALNIVQHAAITGGVPVAFFSLEMSREQLALRMLCSEARIDAQRVRTGFLSEEDWPRITAAAGMLAEAKIFIDDTPALPILEMRAKARRLQAEQGLGLVVVDYLQLMRGRHNVERREQEISEISRSLKAMAKELNVPVIALSQLNRKVEDRPNKRPQMSDLRESGAIEQDADVIMFIYRDEVYNKAEDNPNKGKAEIIVGKQRNGPTGVVHLAFISKLSSFGNLSYEPEPEPEGY